MTPLSHDRAPYAEAVALNAAGEWHRLSVPGHQNQPARHLGLASLAGPRVLAVDTPPLTEGIDLNPPGLSGPTPFEQALTLAADAWGARRTWFLTNGASQGNHATCMALRRLAPHMVVQRSVHSSVIDGSINAGMRLHFAFPSIDLALGIAHGVTPETLNTQLEAHPGGAAAYVVSPSYLGAIADIRALREVAHSHGVPLVVDEAWGAHLGFHSSLPRSALQCGADVVISSTHKLAGSLSQSAMLHLGHGPFADQLEPALERTMLAVSSTSQSAILLASLDLARQDLMIHSEQWMPQSVASADLARELITTDGRFTIPNARITTFPDVYELDPLKLVVDTRSGGISGHSARDILENAHKIHVEMSTDSMVVGLIGALSIIDSEYVAQAFAALPREDLDARPAIELPDAGPRAMDIREAYFSETEVISAAVAEGRVSADSIAAYPPGVPNVLPGEVFTSEVLKFLKDTAAAPYGYVRGALDATVSSVRVVTR